MKKSSVFKVVISTVTIALLVAALTVPGQASRRPGALMATLRSSTGAVVGSVKFLPTKDGKVTVRVAASGLTPGFHGYHVHTTGVCDPAATDSAGAPSPFFTAGGHYNPATTASHGAHAGDMPPLLATEDGTALLKFKTDRFRTRALMDEDRSAVIVHAGPDNLAHVPATTPTGADRYHSHVDDVFGADTATKATGDAGARFACGVIKRFTT